MSEVLNEVKTFTVKYECDDCGGNVIYSGSYNPTNPPKCHHVCQGCNKKYIFLTTYPNTMYKDV